MYMLIANAHYHMCKPCAYAQRSAGKAAVADLTVLYL
jgi:hypothetical protein